MAAFPSVGRIHLEGEHSPPVRFPHKNPVTDTLHTRPTGDPCVCRIGSHVDPWCSYSSLEPKGVADVSIELRFWFSWEWVGIV